MKIMTVFLIIFLIGLFTIRHFVVGGYPYDPNNKEFYSVTVPQGAGTKTIASLLKENDIIKNERVFRVLAKIDKYEGRLQAGNFSLSPSMSMHEILDALLAAKGDTVRFTVPEGLDLARTAETLAKQGLIDIDVFWDEVENGDFDYWFIDKLPKNSQRLEGFLFPETYEIFVNSSEHAIIDKMLGQFDKVFTEEHITRMNELGKDINEVIILASIIEREALVSEDRPIISGVFQNRLDINMALQSCATVQYILGEVKPVLSTADTQIESPYNTYIYTGLPPGPISSPGKESIDAALWPVETDYLFFLAKGDGSHVFSRTYDEHLKYKAQYID